MNTKILKIVQLNGLNIGRHIKTMSTMYQQKRKNMVIMPCHLLLISHYLEKRWMFGNTPRTPNKVSICTKFNMKKTSG